MSRIQKLIAAVGKKGVGKTFTTNKQIVDYVRGNPAKGVPGRRVLILDVNNEFEHIRTMNKKHVLAFSAHPTIEARRIAPFNDDGSKMSLLQVYETLSHIIANYSNGLLIIEDINRYIGDHMKDDLIGAICTNRHANLDVILHYQSIGRIQTKVWQNINIIRFHQMTDSVVNHVNKFKDGAECFFLAEHIVNYVCKTDPRYYLWVDVEILKIQGNIKPELKTIAINKYLNDNFKKLIKSQVGRIDIENPTAPPLTEPQIVEKEKKRLLETYF